MRLGRIGVLLAGAALCAPLTAQMHKVEKPEVVVRAVGVYEWTGDMAKPTASRFIPVTLFIDNSLQDAGLYLARPVPFALDTGTVYELQSAGVPKGMLELEFARHLQAASAAELYDDGWFGYGRYHGPVAPKKSTAKLGPARISASSGIIVDPELPHFVNRAGKPVTPGAGGGQADAGSTQTAKADTDSDRPHLSRRKDDAAKDPGATPAGDPDRPTMKRRSGSDTTASNDSGKDADTSVPADDPDRPTLKRHAKDTKKPDNDVASVTGTDTLNDDPNRPILHRGKVSDTGSDLPKLTGPAIDAQQMVAVSDAADRPVHDFSRPWDDTEERAAILSKMEAFAQQQISAYGGAAAPAPVAPARRAGANSKLRRPVKRQQVAAPISLEDEKLQGYLLSYGDVPTFVYQAHTAGDGAGLRYVTLVAQMNAQQEPQLVLHSVTDATHLDRTPLMRLVDAVDVDASHRASLLFELRAQQSRQFAVYRVLGLQAQQIFATGAMQ